MEGESQGVIIIPTWSLDNIGSVFFLIIFPFYSIKFSNMTRKDGFCKPNTIDNSKYIVNQKV